MITIIKLLFGSEIVKKMETSNNRANIYYYIYYAKYMVKYKNNL